MNELWIWLTVGLVPYHIRHQYTPDGTRVLTVRALFWSLHVQRLRSGQHDWTVQVPLIERTRDVVWAVVLRLHGAAQPEERE